MMKDIPSAAKKGTKAAREKEKERQRDKYDPPLILPGNKKQKETLFGPQKDPEVRAFRKQEEHGPKKFIKP